MGRRSRGTVLPGRNRLGGSQEQERASREGDVQCRRCCPSEEGVCSGKAMGSGRNDLMCAIWRSLWLLPREWAGDSLPFSWALWLLLGSHSRSFHKHYSLLVCWEERPQAFIMSSGDSTSSSTSWGVPLTQGLGLAGGGRSLPFQQRHAGATEGPRSPDRDLGSSLSATVYEKT